MMKNFLRKYQITDQWRNNPEATSLEWIESRSNKVTNFIRKYGGTTFNNGLFRIHTFETSQKWTELIVDNYFKEEVRGLHLICFGFNWQGCMYCTNEADDLKIYFDPATCEFFKSENTSLSEFFDDILSNGEYDVVAEEYFKEAMDFLKLKNISYDDSIGHKIYLHLGGEDNVDNLEVVNTEVLWDLQIQIANRINELPEN